MQIPISKIKEKKTKKGGMKNVSKTPSFSQKSISGNQEFEKLEPITREPYVIGVRLKY